LCFILVYGYFVLSVIYPKTFGKYLICYLEHYANKDILRLIEQNSPTTQPTNKKNSTFKRKTRYPYYNKKRKNNLKKINLKKRGYFTTRKLNGIYETYASIKTAAWSVYMVVEKIGLCEVGKALDKAVGISSAEAFKILDVCSATPHLCSFYVAELAKTPDSRNLATDAFSIIKY
jgi:hypothetical protein